jgi:hypothetical protein
MSRHSQGCEMHAVLQPTTLDTLAILREMTDQKRYRRFALAGGGVIVDLNP